MGDIRYVLARIDGSLVNDVALWSQRSKQMAAAKSVTVFASGLAVPAEGRPQIRLQLLSLEKLINTCADARSRIEQTAVADAQRLSAESASSAFAKSVWSGTRSGRPAEPIYTAAWKMAKGGDS